MAVGLIVVLLVLGLGAIPAWPHSRDWVYYPSSGLVRWRTSSRWPSC